MHESELFIKLLLTVVFGAILGLESETREIANIGIKNAKKAETQRLGGFRTYTLISLFGGLAGIFYALEAFTFAYILFATVVILIVSAYYLNVKIKKAFGLTTEIAIVMTFTLGFLTTSSLIRFEILLGILVLMAFFLSQKRGIGQLIHKVQHNELIDVIKFGLIALIVLPILPNQDYYLFDLLNFVGLENINNENLKSIYLANPFKIWTIVVLISGINLLSYFLSRMWGAKRGILLTSVFGGFFSSTSTLISFTSKVKQLDNQALIKKYAGGAILSTGVSFILAGFLFLITDLTLFKTVLPILLLMLATGIVVGLRFFVGKDKKEEIGDNRVIYEPFSIVPAIKFVSLILVITLIIQFLQFWKLNEFLIIAVTALSGITGIDAPIIAISSLFNSETILLNVAVITFILTNTINLLAKAAYAKVLGNQEFFKYILIGLSLIALSSLVGLLLVI